MRIGKFLIINLETTKPTLLVQHCEAWPANDIWDFAKWEESYKSILKDDEKFNLHGDPPFLKMPTFALGIKVKNADCAAKLAEVLPNEADFKRINIV